MPEEKSKSVVLVQTEMSFLNKERDIQEPGENPPIDYSFPEGNANKLARQESFNKHLFRPNTYLHKWWARRSGATFRYILKQLTPSPDHRDYYSAGGLEGLTILDPMTGGGTILHEAIRLGANVIGFDIDPIPVIQARASLVNIPWREKERIFRYFYRKLREKLNPFYTTICPDCNLESEIKYTLYGSKKSCNCGEVLMVDSFLIKEADNGASIKMEDFFPDKKVVRETKSWPILEKNNRVCERCDAVFENCINYSYSERYEPLIIAGFCPRHGHFYKAVDENDLSAIKQSHEILRDMDVPSEDSLHISSGPKSDDLLKKNISSYLELFSPRQLLYIASAKSLLDNVEEKHRLWLSVLVSTSLEFNSMLCGYKGAYKRRPGAIRHVFSHHAYTFPYTALENNPVFHGKSSGTLQRLFSSRIKRAGEWADSPIERIFENSKWQKVEIKGEKDYGVECSSIHDFEGQKKHFLVEQHDSSQLPLPEDSVDFVVTDPPYYNSVQYSDLSRFFRVWLQWFLPNEASWQFMHNSSAVAETSSQGDKYKEILGAIFSECNRVLKPPHGRLIFTFHHWNPEAWIKLTLSLKNAKFQLINSFTVHSENPISVHIRNLKALQHDSILVLKPTRFGKSEIRFTSINKIDKKNSFNFCRDCSRLLGFILENDMSEKEIEKIWQNAIRD